MNILIIALAVLFFSYPCGSVPKYGLSKFAGWHGQLISQGDEGKATAASLNKPFGVFVDSLGSCYISELAGNKIRKIDSNQLITNFGGSGIASSSGNGLVASSATFNHPSGLWADSLGNLYVSETSGNSIRQVTGSSHIVSLFSGTGASSVSAMEENGDSGTASAATVNSPCGVYGDTMGSVFIADTNNNRIRKVDSASIITTVAGTGATGFNTEVWSATAATLTRPQGVFVSVFGDLIVSDTDNHRVRLVSTDSKLLQTIVGSGTDSIAANKLESPATAMIIHNPVGLWMDSSENLYIAAVGDCSLQLKSSGGDRASIIVGNGHCISKSAEDDLIDVSFQEPMMLHGAQDNVFVTYPRDGTVQSVKKVFTQQYHPASAEFLSSIKLLSSPSQAPTAVPTLFGDKIYNIDLFAGVVTSSGHYCCSGITNLPATSAVFASNYGVFASTTGVVYIMDVGNKLLRAVDTAGIIHDVNTNVGTQNYGPISSCYLPSPYGITGDTNGNIFVAGVSDVRKISSSGIISLYAGGTVLANSGLLSNGDGGPFTSALFSFLQDLMMDTNGHLYVADSGNSKVRVLRADGILKTVIGTGADGHSGNGGQATSAKITNVAGFFPDVFGKIYVADTDDHTIRLVDTSGIINIFVGTGEGGAATEGMQATSTALNYPASMYGDTSGNLYFNDIGGPVVMMVSVTCGCVFTIGGGGAVISNGGPAVLTLFDSLSQLTMDSLGSLYVVDDGTHNVVLKMTLPSSPTVAPTIAPSVSFVPSVSFEPTFSPSFSPATRVFGLSAFAGAVSAGTYLGDSGKATGATMRMPLGVFASSTGSVYIMDNGNNVIRIVNGGTIFSMNDGSSSDRSGPVSSCVIYGTTVYGDTNGKLFVITDFGVVRKISASTISSFAGEGPSGSVDDGQAGTSTHFIDVRDITIDSNGFLYLADNGTKKVRRIDASGIVSSVAGGALGDYGDYGDGGPATNAFLDDMDSMFMASNGNLYVCDYYSAQIRIVTPDGIINSFTGRSGNLKDDLPASSTVFGSAYSVRADTVGNVFVIDASFRKIKMVSAVNGRMYTIGFSGATAYSGDGGLALLGSMSYFGRIALDTNGNIYVSTGYSDDGPTDLGNTVRKLTYFNAPTFTPTTVPTSSKPSIAPSAKPSIGPTLTPTTLPTIAPTPLPTVIPSISPTVIPTILPTLVPTRVPTTTVPSIAPTVIPSRLPTVNPTVIPTVVPTPSPTILPTIVPTALPTTTAPTIGPTLVPTCLPTVVPTIAPSVIPTVGPSLSPTVIPTALPTTTAPTIMPSVNPSVLPSVTPSVIPTITPSVSPSVIPTLVPTALPTTTAPTVGPSILPTVTPTVIPSLAPTLLPTVLPTVVPTTTAPTIIPSILPSVIPTVTPTVLPTVIPTIAPSVLPTLSPTVLPTTTSPSIVPSILPSVLPSVGPTLVPTVVPTLTPTVLPTVVPTALPTTTAPTIIPSILPTVTPTVTPTVLPTVIPTVSPSLLPTMTPTVLPTTTAPTIGPTVLPSVLPTVSPTVVPTLVPTVSPTLQPTILPSVLPTTTVPTVIPSLLPTVIPSIGPTVLPTIAPTGVPTTTAPTIVPSILPTLTPTVGPSLAPTAVPSQLPTVIPTTTPTVIPTTTAPTVIPSLLPSLSPTVGPSVSPTLGPSVIPTVIPSLNPSVVPTIQPSVCPSQGPTTAPSVAPTVLPTTTTPTLLPSVLPSLIPTVGPSVIPSVSPTQLPTVLPSVTPTTVPTTLTPSIAPSMLPSCAPTLVPTSLPTLTPTLIPSGVPSQPPSIVPTVVPSLTPTFVPTVTPSLTPSVVPSVMPSVFPTVAPSVLPTTICPSVGPSVLPTVTPTALPSVLPSLLPSVTPSVNPSAAPSVTPSLNPSLCPTVAPTALPTSLPPTIQPSVSPSIIPTTGPSMVPSVGPSENPSVLPSVGPTVAPMTTSPSLVPSSGPSQMPSVSPSMVPTVTPSMLPTASPTTLPTAFPSQVPVLGPSVIPTLVPSLLPSVGPSLMPTVTPSISPTMAPTVTPSFSPSTSPSVNPSVQPTVLPTAVPTSAPVVVVSLSPSSGPTTAPVIGATETPSCLPTHSPTQSPTLVPSVSPSLTPTVSPSTNPTCAPAVGPTKTLSGCPSILPSTITPSVSPSTDPSVAPSCFPTTIPSTIPSKGPSVVPSMSPTAGPSLSPSVFPTVGPTLSPSVVPSVLPTTAPSVGPSTIPTVPPSDSPSIRPSALPSSRPSAQPTSQPSSQPSCQPTTQPSSQPSSQPVMRPSSQPSSQPTGHPSMEPTVTQTSAAPSSAAAYVYKPAATLPDHAMISVMGLPNGNITSFKILLPYLVVIPSANRLVTKNIVLPQLGSYGTGYVAFGGKAMPKSVSISDSIVYSFGFAVSPESNRRSAALLKDFNGDGIHDLVIGDPYLARCYVLFGTEDGLTNMTRGFTIFGESESDLTGWSVSDAGDVNKDSLNDLIIGAPNANGNGAFYVLYGSRRVLYDVFLSNLTLSHYGIAVYSTVRTDALGISVSNAGDVNRDGYDDVIVGAVMTSTFNAGAAYVLYGGNALQSILDVSQLSSTKGFQVVGATYSLLGYSVAGVGDVNRDGFADVLIGSCSQKTGLSDAAYLIYGSNITVSGTLVLSPSSVFRGVYISGAGVMVSYVGDVNRDGYDDILIGGNYEFGSRTTGYVFVNRVGYVANPTFNPTVTPTATRSPSFAKTIIPSLVPTPRATLKPSVLPTVSPTTPTLSPTHGATQPTSQPSTAPTLPTLAPSDAPTVSPSGRPSEFPTLAPSNEPSEQPSYQPTVSPSLKPSAMPVEPPSEYPSMSPTIATTRPPKNYPTLMPSTLIPTSTELPQLVVSNQYVMENPLIERSNVNYNYVFNCSVAVTVTGIGGADVFTVLPVSNVTITIEYFNATTDIINLESFDGISEFSQINMTKGSVLIHLPNHQLMRIMNLNPVNMTADHFVLFSHSSDDGAPEGSKLIAIVLKISYAIIGMIFVGLAGGFLLYTRQQHLLELEIRATTARIAKQNELLAQRRAEPPDPHFLKETHRIYLFTLVQQSGFAVEWHDEPDKRNDSSSSSSSESIKTARDTENEESAHDSMESIDWSNYTVELADSDEESDKQTEKEVESPERWLEEGRAAAAASTAAAAKSQQPLLVVEAKVEDSGSDMSSIDLSDFTVDSEGNCVYTSNELSVVDSVENI